MLDSIRHYSNLFYRDGNRVPVPQYEYLLQKKAPRDIECFRLFAYVVYETPFFSTETKLYFKTGMGFRQLGELLNKNQSTIRSTVSADSRKALLRFGDVSIACSEFGLFKDNVYQSNLSESNIECIDRTVIKLGEYLKSLGISLEAPTKSIELEKIENLETASNIYSETVNRLKEEIDLAKNSNNNLNINLQTEVDSLKNTNSKLDNSLTELRNTANKLESELETVKNSSKLLNGDLLGLAGLFNPALDSRSIKTGDFNSTSAIALVESLTEYVHLRANLIKLINSSSIGDVEMINQYLLGVKSYDKDFNDLMERTIKYAWKYQERRV